MRHQLIKSASSVGANYEEAQEASSKKDFNNKIRIVLKEARESNYWLRLIYALGYHSEELNKLLQEKHIWRNSIKSKSRINPLHLPFAFLLLPYKIKL